MSIGACLLTACMNNPLFLLDPDPATTTEGSGTATTTEDGSTSGEPTTTAPPETTSTASGSATTTDTTAALTSGAPSTTNIDTSESGATTTSDATTSTSDTTTGSDTDTTSDTSSAASSGGDASSGDGPFCGDGFTDPDEECDAGANNSDSNSCTSNCKVAACGDHLQNTQGDNPEKCDDGLENGTGLGKCSIDCKAVVSNTTYKIILSGTGVPGSLHVDNGMLTSGIPAGDEACNKVALGSKILAADGVKRRAALVGWKPGGQIDWVLKPYTGYTDSDGKLLGITGNEGLLGIQNGKFMPLMKAITTNNEQATWTGLHADWTTAENTCEGWTSTSGSKTGKIGNSGLIGGYLDGAGSGNCTNPLRIYCVEQ